MLWQVATTPLRTPSPWRGDSSVTLRVTGDRARRDLLGGPRCTGRVTPLNSFNGVGALGLRLGRECLVAGRAAIQLAFFAMASSSRSSTELPTPHNPVRRRFAGISGAPMAGRGRRGAAGRLPPPGGTGSCPAFRSLQHLP